MLPGARIISGRRGGGNCEISGIGGVKIAHLFMKETLAKGGKFQHNLNL